MLIKPGDALPMRLREFGMLVTDECTEAVRGFKDGSERDAGDAIRKSSVNSLASYGAD